MEKLRDPSHVRALSLAELQRLMADFGLVQQQAAFYRLEMEVEKLSHASFPNEGDADKIRQIFIDELSHPRMDVGVRREGAAIHFGYPIAVLLATKPEILP
jgi:hypothetical protein